MMRLGILGGMGPLATADLLRKLTLATPAERDQDHFRVIVDSHPQIPDRTEHILGEGEDPVPAMKASLDLLASCGVDLVMMPCNTAHYYHEKLNAYTSMELVDMVGLTVERVKRDHAEERVFLLATQGTYRTGIYQKRLPELMTPPNEVREALMDVIRWVKANRIAEAAALMDSLLEGLKGDVYILGCTELSALVAEHPLQGTFIDPMQVMVEFVINQKTALR